MFFVFSLTEIKEEALKLFNKIKPVIGMIHTDALPGTPKYSGDVKSIINNSLLEAEIYSDNGIDIIMIENMHDVPYLNRTAGPEIVSLMSIIAYEIKNKTGLPVGIQILAGGNKQALAAALASGSDFIRAEGFVFGHIADEGYFDSDAGEILRYRKAIGAEQVKVFTDIKKKHSSHSITADVTIAETAKAAEFFLSDGVIITGGSTGMEPLIDEIIAVKEKVNIPVLAGSGITLNNIESFYNHCDGFVIGSYFKDEGNWMNKVNAGKVKAFMQKIQNFNLS